MDVKLYMFVLILNVVTIKIHLYVRKIANQVLFINNVYQGQ